MHAILVAQTTSIYRVCHRLAFYQSFETLRHGEVSVRRDTVFERNALRPLVLAQSREIERIDINRFSETSSESILFRPFCILLKTVPPYRLRRLIDNEVDFDLT